MLLNRYKLEEYPRVGTTRQFIAQGKRDAIYGCAVYDNGKWCWINLGTGFGTASVPFDLVQVNPAEYWDGESLP
ncbi:hypothetical protein LCGC14_2993910 [marine sediment metagenome]|uniref:Uncharacterized protein n=1 Tax=marine sediment metagenome TaxID=412755 RepID=A0A0F8X316_9ZZZZ